VHDFDVTAGFDWTLTLWRTHLNSGPVEFLVLREGGEITGILPLYRSARRIRAVLCRNIAPISELYCGRTGFLLRTPNHASVDVLFANLLTKVRSWDVLTLTLVRGSSHDRLLRDWTSANGFYLQAVENQDSPFVYLQENWEEHFASLPKKFRSTIRNGEKRLRERGTLTYQECCSPRDAESFNAAVFDIEKDSWKAAARTSIASKPVHEAFHRAMTIRAAESRFFNGHMLLLDGQPIAYVMGLLYNGVFLDLKESYRDSLRESSPGHVLKNFVFARLYERRVKLCDFMGHCEAYKMKWTNTTYSRTTYLLFNKTLRARVAHWLTAKVGCGQPLMNLKMQSPSENGQSKNSSGQTRLRGKAERRQSICAASTES